MSKKALTPEEIKVQDDINRAKSKLWTMGNLEFKLKGIQKEFKEYLKHNPSDISVILASRRVGKCLHEDTEILTDSGAKKIKDIQPGEFVFGYGLDGKISRTRVKDKYYNGEKLVYDFINHTRIIETATIDHKWLGIYTDHRIKIKEVDGHELKKTGVKILRRFVDFNKKGKRVFAPYALGALLGDGCSRQGAKNQSIYISSADEEIVKKVADSIECHYKKQNINNYTWIINHKDKKNNDVKYNGKNKKYIKLPEFYNEWCEGKYAHEKIIDLEEIKKWDRESLLELLAGLIDTDGSITVSSNILTIQYGSQSKSILEAIQWIIQTFFQYKFKILLDSRDKYVNGPCYCMTIRNNLFSKRIIKTLDKYLICTRKKWKDWYSNLPENNSNSDYIGVKLVNPRIAKTYDLEVENDSHLYLTANGLVTHNSHTLECYSIEEAIKNPGSIIKYAAPTQGLVVRNLIPDFLKIIEDCPLNIKPSWVESKKAFIFPNGSQIQIVGVDNGRADNLRGGASILAIVDEAAYVDQLSYLIYSVLAPTLDTTGGKLVLASTPNSTIVNHPFHTDFVIPRLASGELKKYTIYDSPLLSEKEIKKVIDRYPGGVDDPQFRCEYLCEISSEQSSLVIPEFNDTTKKDIIRETEMPVYYHAYVSGDPAVVDLTGILFAYTDFLRNKLIIVDELVLGGEGKLDVTTDDIASGIKRKESLYFYNPLTKEKIEPKMRVMDNSHKLLINDLHKEHGLAFFPTAKDQKDLQINKLRMMIKNGQIEINPRCKNLIYHLGGAQWDKNKTGFQRVRAQGEYQAHHADLVDALLYLVRNVDMTSNPYPPNYFEGGSSEHMWGFGRGKDKTVYQSIKSILNIKR